MTKYLLALISLTALTWGISMWSYTAALIFVGLFTGIAALASFSPHIK